MHWQATVTWRGVPDQPVEDTLDALTDALADRGAAVTTAAHNTWTAALTVEATTLRQATVTALQAVTAAAHTAGMTMVTHCAVEVLDDATADQRALEPVFPAVVTATQAGELLEVSRQRVQQLAEEPGFPRALGEVGGQRVWSEEAIRRYAATRDRRPGPRRRTA